MARSRPRSRPSARPRRLKPIHLQREEGVYRTDEIDQIFSLWREPYRLMLSCPWWGFLLLIAAGYLAINLLFAGLYLLDPAGIGGVPEGRAAGFSEAFFFSVQTLGSIGYGVLHPRSLTVNLLVMLQALVSLIFTAVTTGLVFARFSRSKAEILFSEIATVQPWNGVPCLTFRMANVHHNSLVEGHLNVFLGMDELSTEGQRMRRVHTLKLVRNHAFHFRLMWTVMHLIDEHSPLAGLSIEQLKARHGEILVSFHGIDETVRSPVFARMSYPASQLRPDETFEDIVLDQGDGDRFLDFSRFNLTRQRPPATPTAALPIDPAPAP
jgi:inward rectifier potassium channel